MLWKSGIHPNLKFILSITAFMWKIKLLVFNLLCYYYYWTVQRAEIIVPLICCNVVHCPAGGSTVPLEHETGRVREAGAWGPSEPCEHSQCEDGPGEHIRWVNPCTMSWHPGCAHEQEEEEENVFLTTQKFEVKYLLCHREQGGRWCLLSLQRNVFWVC